MPVASAVVCPLARGNSVVLAGETAAQSRATPTGPGWGGGIQAWNALVASWHGSHRCVGVRRRNSARPPRLRSVMLCTYFSRRRRSSTPRRAVEVPAFVCQPPMGFFFRKSIRLGPLRLNLSKSGIGVSTGIKGLRFGTGPRGAYVHVGAGGFYYRQSLGGARPHRSLSAARIPNGAVNTAPTTSDLMAALTVKAIESGSISAMQDSSSADLLRELNATAARTACVPIVLIAAAVAVVVCLVASAPYAVWIGVCTVAAASWIVAARRDATALVLPMTYEIESGPFMLAYEQMARAFDAAAAADQFSVVDGKGAASFKYHGGAKVVTATTRVRPRRGLPPRVQSNLQIPVLPAGQETLYFFPDRLLVQQAKQFGAVAYSDLLTDGWATRTIEPTARPRDAEQIGVTWQHPAQNGGPDGRFRDNAQYPIYSFAGIRFSAPSGLREEFCCSNKAAGFAFVESLDALREIHRSHADAPTASATRGVGLSGSQESAEQPVQAQPVQQQLARGKFGCVVMMVVIVVAIIVALARLLGPPYTGLANDERDGCRQEYATTSDRALFEECMRKADVVERGGR